MQVAKKNEELCWMVEEKGWSWRSWRSRLVNKHIFWRSTGGNALEGQGYEFLTAYDTIVSMWAESMPVPVWVRHGVRGGGGRGWDTNDKSIWEVQISARVPDATEILLSLTTVKNVMVSMNEDSWHWAGEVPAGQVGWREEVSSGSRKVEVVSNSVFNGNWGFGTTDMFLDRSHMMWPDIPEISDLCKVLLWSSLSRWRDTQMAHQLLIFSQKNRIAFCSQ